jgi:hypothetical protein
LPSVGLVPYSVGTHLDKDLSHARGKGHTLLLVPLDLGRQEGVGPETVLAVDQDKAPPRLGVGKLNNADGPCWGREVKHQSEGERSATATIATRHMVHDSNAQVCLTLHSTQKPSNAPGHPMTPDEVFARAIADALSVLNVLCFL